MFSGTAGALFAAKYLGNDLVEDLFHAVEGIFNDEGDHKNFGCPIEFKNSLDDHCFSADFNEVAGDSPTHGWAASDVHAFVAEANDVVPHGGADDFACVKPIHHLAKENKVVEESSDVPSSFSVRLAGGFDTLDVFGLDVLAVDLASDFPTADVIGA